MKRYELHHKKASNGYKSMNENVQYRRVFRYSVHVYEVYPLFLLPADEIVTASCTTTSDTRCQCKPGTFCVPDQACEVCKRCAK